MAAGQAYLMPSGCKTLCSGSTVPGQNKVMVESPVGDAVTNVLKMWGHDVPVGKPFSIDGHATAVLVDPATNVRMAGVDARRYSYEIAH